MNLDEVRKIVGSGQKACKELGVSDRSWTKWAKDDLIPLKHQVKLSELHPELKIMESSIYANKVAERINKKKLSSTKDK